MLHWFLLFCFIANGESHEHVREYRRLFFDDDSFTAFEEEVIRSEMELWQTLRQYAAGKKKHIPEGMEVVGNKVKVRGDRLPQFFFLGRVFLMISLQGLDNYEREDLLRRGFSPDELGLLIKSIQKNRPKWDRVLTGIDYVRNHFPEKRSDFTKEEILAFRKTAFKSTTLASSFFLLEVMKELPNSADRILISYLNEMKTHCGGSSNFPLEKPRPEEVEASRRTLKRVMKEAFSP